MKNNKVVLAYSGGLDTSFCTKYLSEELGLEVHAVSVNTGGFEATEIVEMEKKAKALGAHSFTMIDAREMYYKDCVRYLIYGNVLRNQSYPLSVSAERMFQATVVIKQAQLIGAQQIAHGSTGAGNDQVRFDLVFNILAPEIKIITPIRDLQLSRKEEIDYLKKYNVDWSWEKAKYSINKGLWGTSVGGAETLTSHQALPEEAYPYPLENNDPEKISLSFEKGELKKLNGQTFEHPVQAIQTLEQLANSYAIGRDIHVGDTIIGIKGRVGFSAAAAIITIKSHALLEKHVLGKWQSYWKEQLANWYGMLLHEGQLLDPVMRNIECFLKDTQKNVTGTVFVALHPYRFELLGIDSPFDLMNDSFGQYGEMNKGWTGEEVKGFTKILSNAGKIHHQINTGKSWH